MKNAKQIVLILSAALTSMIVGIFISTWIINDSYKEKLGDPKYLEKLTAKLNSDAESAPAPRRVKKVRTAPAVKEKLGSTRFFSGRLLPIQKVVVASEISGPVVSMPIDVGTTVKKGETVIADIDTVWARLAKEQAEKQLYVSQVKLRFEQDEFKRLSNLNQMGKGMISESDLEMQRLKVEELDANIALQKVVLNEATEKLSRSVIVAPFDGTVVSKIAEVGAYVSPGSPVAEIVSSGQIDAELTITENYIDRLHVGDKVPVWIDPLNLETEGEIFSIVPYGSTAARAFPIRIRMDDMDGRLKVGMSVRGRIQVTDPKTSIVLPKDAVLDRPDGALVWVVVDEKSEKEELTGRKVTLPVQVMISARTDEQYAVVPMTEEGHALLSPGVGCVIEGAERLAVGEEVEVIGIDPAMLANLPKAFGHVILPTLEENPFFSLDQEKNAPSTTVDEEENASESAATETEGTADQK